MSLLSVKRWKFYYIQISLLQNLPPMRKYHFMGFAKPIEAARDSRQVRYFRDNVF